MGVKASRTASIALACCIALACGEDPEEQDPTVVIRRGNPNGKDDGGVCGKDFDCKSGVCATGKCAEPTSSDKVLNGEETGVDCGGPDAPTCGGGQSCKVDGDCTSGECASSKCTGPADAPPPTGEDGIKNGDETDVDCGGKKTGAGRCLTNKACLVADDCESGVCFGERCAAPSPTDKIQNGDESDVDCGGRLTGAPKCDVGKKCVENSDCAGDGCDDNSRCAIARSCTRVDGGLTCGTGEVDDPGAKHESCCVALPVPGMPNVKLDKYKLTAGRMRTFLDRVQGDVKGWYAANKATLSPAAVAQIDPYVAFLPADMDEANYHIGGAVFFTDRPSISQGCFTGSAANPANGAHTFWTPGDPGLPEADKEDRAFDKAFLDRLPLNCTPYPIVAAMCAWDGGRLQTFEESVAAFGAGPYPWGASPVAGGFNDNGAVIGPAHVPIAEVAACPGCDTTLMNWRSSYQNPPGGVAAKPWDYAYYISPPGRFPTDKGAGGHMDLGGVMMEWTASVNGQDDAAHQNQNKMRWSKAGSFEIHQVNYGGYAFAFMTKYGKAGARCARD